MNWQVCPKCRLFDTYQGFELHRRHFEDWLRFRQIRVPLSVAGVEAPVRGPVGSKGAVDIDGSHGAIDVVLNSCQNFVSRSDDNQKRCEYLYSQSDLLHRYFPSVFFS